MGWERLATLVPQSLQSVTSQIAQNCPEAELDLAFARYPGKHDRTTVLWDNIPHAERVRNCLEAVGEENYTQPYLSRIVEIGWKREMFRSNVMSEVRGLLNVGLDPAELVVAVGQGLDIVAAALPPLPPVPGADKRMLHVVGPVRHLLSDFSKGLLACRELKAIHDSLHLLQSLGAPWLEEPDPAQWPPVTPLIASLDRSAAAIDAARASVVQMPDMLETLTKSARVLARARTDFLAGGAKTQEAMVALRQELNIRQPVIDSVMFGLCRDMPFKALGFMFAAAARIDPVAQPALEAASAGAGLLCEKLRSCMMAHSLWQSVDEKLYALEEMFDDIEGLTAADIEAITTHWKPAARMLSALADDASDSASPIGVFRAAVFFLVEALARAADGDQAAATEVPTRLAVLPDAFDALKRQSRQRFFDADKAMKALIEDIGRRKPAIDGILQRVPILWDVGP